MRERMRILQVSHEQQNPLAAESSELISGSEVHICRDFVGTPTHDEVEISSGMYLNGIRRIWNQVKYRWFNRQGET
jgi:hypothetical protein